jgi:hypothetical protein
LYNAEDIFESLNFHHQECMFDDLVEIRMQRAPEGAEEPESEPKERTITVVKFIAWLGLIEGSI